MTVVKYTAKIKVACRVGTGEEAQSYNAQPICDFLAGEFMAGDFLAGVFLAGVSSKCKSSIYVSLHQNKRNRQNIGHK
jgi:hypothetical protein